MDRIKGSKVKKLKEKKKEITEELEKTKNDIKQEFEFIEDGSAMGIALIALQSHKTILEIALCGLEAFEEVIQKIKEER